MINFAKKLFILCGIVFGLAAFPVLAQQEQREVIINKRPLKDFGEIAKQKILSGKVDLDKNFSVSFVGELTKDGKLDTSLDEKTKIPKSRFIRSEGDAEMAELAKQFVEALSDSGWFVYLRNLGIEKFTTTISQDAETFSILTVGENLTDEKAKTVANGINKLIQGALIFDRNGTRKLDDDSRRVISNTKVTTQEKNVIINVSLPKAEFKEMIQRQINNSETKTNG